MSVMLSDPHEAENAGGQFVTWADGLPVVHDVGKGDAVLFHSLKAHNVATVTRGTRHTMVIELWDGGTNVCDRDQ